MGGRRLPADYQSLIAKTFGTTTHAFFPKDSRRDGRAEILHVSGVDTADIVARLRASDVDQATLDVLGITVDRLCSEYAYMPSDQLLLEGRQWLGRVAGMQHQRLTLSQHRELMVQAGMPTLLVGCVEYDSGERRTAEATRRAALSIAEETGHSAIAGWAHEIRAWMCLTAGDYRASSRRPTRGLPPRPRRVSRCSCTRRRRRPGRVGEDRLAEQLAREVLRAGTDYDGTERAPMRNAEARVTLGVVAARAGDLETAINYGELALGGTRRSIPSLVIVSEDLGTVLEQQYAGQRDAEDFLGHLRSQRAG